MKYDHLKCNTSIVSMVPNAATEEMKAMCKMIELKIAHTTEQEVNLKERIRQLYEDQILNMITEFNDKVIPPGARPPTLKNGHFISPEVFKVAVARQPLIWDNNVEVSMTDIYKAFNKNPRELEDETSEENQNDWIERKENQ